MKMTLFKTNGQTALADPFDWMDNLLAETSLGRAIQDGFYNPSEFGTYPAVNIQETKEAYLLELAAPGLDKADFQLSLEGNLLTIAAEKKQSKEEEQKNLVRREFGYRSFKRNFTVDEKIDASRIGAKYENGVLKVILPKQEVPAQVVKTIEVA